MHKDITDVGLGGCKFRGKYCQQHSGVFEVFEQFLPKLDIDLLIELGTGSGVFSEFLFEVKSSNCRFVSIDNIDRRASGDFHFEFFLRDVFDYYTGWEIENMISRSKGCLLMTDAQKIHDVNTFAKYLRSNDLIMAHDYVKNREVFEAEFKGKIWDHMEICDADIQEGLSSGLEPYMPELFNPIVWGAWIKNEK